MLYLKLSPDSTGTRISVTTKLLNQIWFRRSFISAWPTGAFDSRCQEENLTWSSSNDWRDSIHLKADRPIKSLWTIQSESWFCIGGSNLLNRQLLSVCWTKSYYQVSIYWLNCCSFASHSINAGLAGLLKQGDVRLQWCEITGEDLKKVLWIQFFFQNLAS